MTVSLAKSVASMASGRVRIIARAALPRPKTEGFHVQERLFRKGRPRRGSIDEKKSRDLLKQSEDFFQSTDGIPRIRVGKKQKSETLVNEEALLLAKFLRCERDEWMPRTVEGSEA